MAGNPVVQAATVATLVALGISIGLLFGGSDSSGELSRTQDPAVDNEIRIEGDGVAQIGGEGDDTVNVFEAPAAPARRPSSLVLISSSPVDEYFLAVGDRENLIASLPTDPAGIGVTGCHDLQIALVSHGAIPGTPFFDFGLISPDFDPIGVAGIDVTVIDHQPLPEQFTFLSCSDEAGGGSVGYVVRVQLGPDQLEGEAYVEFWDDLGPGPLTRMPPASFDNSPNAYESWQLFLEPQTDGIYTVNLKVDVVADGQVKEEDLGNFTFVYFEEYPPFDKWLWFEYGLGQWVIREQ